MDITIAIKGAAALSRSLKVAKEQEFKDLNFAIRGEAFRLRNILKEVLIDLLSEGLSDSGLMSDENFITMPGSGTA